MRSQTKYKILPFRFERMSGGNVLLTNEVGEFVYLNPEDFDAFVCGSLNSQGSAFKDLAGKQFIACGDMDLAIDMLATKLRTKKRFLEDFTALHMVVPTIGCNSRCIYCQVSSQAPLVGCSMSAETALRVVHTIFRTRSKSIKIEFQGGEPTLRFDIVRVIVLEAEKLNRIHKKHLAFVLCTNLVAITESQLSFLKDHGVLISTSLDGPKAIHDANRPLRDGSGSYDAVVRNLDRARKILGEGSVSALMTVTLHNLFRLGDAISEYRQRGLSSIFIRPLNPYGRAWTSGLDQSYTARQFTAQYAAALDDIVSMNLAGYSMVEEYAAVLLERILTPFGGGFVDLQSPAGCGISGALYNYDGNVYSSDEGRMLGEMGDPKFLMGNVHRHQYGEIFGGPLIRELVYSSIIEGLPGCASCVYCPYCGTDPVRNYVEGGDIVPRPFVNESCQRNMMIFRHLFRLLRSGDNATRDVLWAWATRRPVQEISLGN